MTPEGDTLTQVVVIILPNRLNCNTEFIIHWYANKNALQFLTKILRNAREALTYAKTPKTANVFLSIYICTIST